MQSQQTTEPAQADSNGCADELTRLRSEIDAVDAKIVTLLAERARLARAVGKAKARIAACGTTGDAPRSSNIYRPERERAVIERAIAKGAQCDSLITSESLAAIYGEIISALPVSLQFSPRFYPTEVEFDIRVEPNVKAKIGETRLHENDLRQIIDGTEIILPVKLEKYFPGSGFTPDQKIVIALRLVKRGGLKLNL